MLTPTPAATILWSKVHPRMGTEALPWPARKTSQAAGWDCHAAIDEPLELWTGRLVKVPLGFALALPEGWEAQIRPRSGFASEGIIMPNSPGTVDADYRGEVSALLYALPRKDMDPRLDNLFIEPGTRVCQMVISQVLPVCFQEVDTLPRTDRGSGGFGSTGRR